MAITLVGTPQAGGAANGGDVTLTFDGVLAEGDLVLLVGGNGDANGAGDIGPMTAGYTQAALYQVNDGTDLSAGVWYKFLTSTPDGSVVANGAGSAQEAAAYASLVLRGVDASTPIDVAIVETGPTVGVNPDPGAVTTATAGAWVIAAAVDSNQTPASAGPTGYSNFVGDGADDTRPCSVGLATKEIASAGAEDPGAFSNWGNQFNSWKTFTVVLRPAGAGGTPGTVSPGVLALSAAPQAPSVSGGAASSPGVLALSATPQAPTVSGGAVVEPGVLGLSVTVPQVAVSAGGVAAVGTLALSVTLPAPTVATGGAATVTPEALALALGLPAATTAGGGIVEPDPLAVAASFGMVTVSGGAAVDPNVLAATFTFPAPTVEGGGVAEPQTLPLDVVLNAVTVTGGGVAEPAELALVVTLPQVTVLAGDTTGTWQEGAVTVVVQAGGAGSSGASGGVGLTTQSGDLKAGTQE